MGALALFIAIGGVAGALPGKNSVDNGDVKDLRYKALAMKNGWGASFGTYEPAAAIDAQGTVHLRGGIAQGVAGDENFARLPKALRPDEDVFFVVDQTAANQGRVLINANGEMSAFHEAGGSASNAQLFTSLDGITFSAGK
jgi:hypothetical protein